jgi:exosortase/archaeosortase family protein
VRALAGFLGFDSSVEQVTYVRKLGTDRIYVPTTLLTVGGFRAKIILECSAVHASILLLAFLIAYPSPFTEKVCGIVILIPSLILLNTVRILLLMLLGHYFGPVSSIYAVFHSYVMRFLMIALVLSLALIWLRRVDLRKYDSPIWFFLRFLLISGVLVSVSFFLTHIFGHKAGFHAGSFSPLLVFVSLVVASSRFDLRRDYRDILISLGIMVLFLIFLHGMYLSYTHYSSAGSELLFVLANSAFIYTLPVGLFFLLVRKTLLVETDSFGKRVFVCPLCGKKNIRNLRAHAEAKHYIELRRKEERLMRVVRVSDQLFE